MHRWRTLPLTVLLVCVLPADLRAEPGPQDSPAAAGQSEATSVLQTIEFPFLTDAVRENRPVKIKAIFPAEGGPFPLVIFSHGGAGSWDAHLFEAENLARHGYVAFCLEHPTCNIDTVRKYVREDRGPVKQRFTRALNRIVKDPSAVLGRPRDVSFAIDRAEEWNRSHSRLKGKIDLSRIAVAGHSFGAYTTLTVCGARPILDHLDPPMGTGMAEDLSDPRVTIGIAMSPQGTGTSRFGPGSFSTIRRPLLCFSGSKDEQLGHDGSTQAPETRWEAFELMPDGDKYFVWLENADHLSFADNPKSELLPSPAREDTMRICKAFQLAFCDAYLKDRAEGRSLLTQDHATSLCGRQVPQATLRVK